MLLCLYTSRNMTDLAKMNTLLQSVELEMLRFESKPTKTGATRIRASLLQIKKLADEMRRTVLASAKAIPTKARAKAPAVSKDELPPEPPVLERETTSVVDGIEQPKKVKKKSKKK